MGTDPEDTPIADDIPEGFVRWEDFESRRGPMTPERRAAARSALEAEIAAYHLRELRKQHGLSQARLAERMGVSQRRVSAIERGDMDHVEISTVKAYIEALGGRVRLIAEFDGEFTPIA